VKAREKFRNLFANSMEGILLTRPDGSILVHIRGVRDDWFYEEEICRAGRAGILV
jgi:hypothetical protein